MKKVFMSLLAVAAMASSCSKSEPAGRGDGDGAVEIRLASKAIEATTKAPFEGEISGSNNLTARVLVSTTQANYSAPLYHDGEMTFTDNQATAVGFNTTPAYYPADGSKVYLAGLYPTTGWGSVQDEKNITFPFTGKEDVMAAPQIVSDKKDGQSGGTYKTLAFTHLLTKLDVQVVAASEAAIESWGAVTDITLEKAKDAVPFNKLTVDMTTGKAVTGGWASGDQPLPFYTVDGNDTPFTGRTTALTETETKIAYSLVAPINIENNDKVDYLLNVKTEKHTAAIPVEVDLKTTDSSDFTGSTEGKYFTITLTFNATEIKATATVADWVEGGNSGSTIE